MSRSVCLRAIVSATHKRRERGASPWVGAPPWNTTSSWCTQPGTPNSSHERQTRLGERRGRGRGSSGPLLAGLIREWAYTSRAGSSTEPRTDGMPKQRVCGLQGNGRAATEMWQRARGAGISAITRACHCLQRPAEPSGYAPSVGAVRSSLYTAPHQTAPSRTRECLN